MRIKRYKYNTKKNFTNERTDLKFEEIPGGNFTFCWVSLNNWETIKAVTLAFCIIYNAFIRDACAKSGIPYSPYSLDTEQNSDVGISDFPFLVHHLYKEIVITPEPAPTKQRQKNWRWRHVGKLWRDFPFSNWRPIGAIRKPDSKCIVHKTYIFINSNFLSYKNWKQN